jgi:hypothetical protein
MKSVSANGLTTLPQVHRSVIGMDLATYEAETAFADLTCADPEWLRDEFDALVSASFGQPPAPPRPAPPQVPPDDGDQRPPSRP